MAAGHPGVPGLSVAETAAEESGVERGRAATLSPGPEARPAWVQHRSTKSVISLHVQVKENANISRMNNLQFWLYYLRLMQICKKLAQQADDTQR